MRRRAVAAALIAFATDALGSGRVRFSHLLQAIQPPAHLLQVTVHDGALLRGVGIDVEASVHAVAGAPVLQALLLAAGARPLRLATGSILLAAAWVVFRSRAAPL